MEQSFEKAPGIPGNLEDHTYERAGYMLRKDLKDPTLYILLYSRWKYMQILNGLAKC